MLVFFFNHKSSPDVKRQPISDRHISNSSQRPHDKQLATNSNVVVINKQMNECKMRHYALNPHSVTSTDQHKSTFSPSLPSSSAAAADAADFFEIPPPGTFRSRASFVNYNQSRVSNYFQACFFAHKDIPEPNMPHENLINVPREANAKKKPRNEKE